MSIFGNTGDGKSHTLNHTFFNGREVNVHSLSTCEVFLVEAKVRWRPNTYQRMSY